MQRDVIGFARSELDRYLGALGVEANISLDLFEEHGIDMPLADATLDDAIAISIRNKRGFIAGSNPRSVLIGVYRLLTEWGVGFVRPGKLGEYIPQKTDAKDIEIREAAARRYRTVCIEGACSLENVLDMIDWLPKVGFNSYLIQFSRPKTFLDRWYSHEKNPIKKPEQFTEEMVDLFHGKMKEEIKRRDLILHTMGHGWTCIPFGIPDNGWYAVDPEKMPKSYLSICALVKGERRIERNIPLYTQLCYSNPEVATRIADSIVEYAEQHPEADIINFSLGDFFNNTCECEGCTKLRFSDYYVRIMNDAIDKMIAKGLTAKLCFCVYYNSAHPPLVERIKHPERTLIEFPPISRSFAASLPNGYTVKTIPEYKVNEYELVFGKTADVADNLAYLYAWKEIYDGDALIFDYHLMWDHMLDAGGEGIARVLYDDIGTYDALEFNGHISCQLQRNAFPSSIVMTTMAKRLWNKNADFDEIRRELYAKTFGEDMADVMCEYFATLSRAFDVGVIRNLKFFDMDEARRNFEAAVAAMDAFGPIIEENIEKRTDKAQRESWIYLRHHREMYSRVGRAILLIIDGNRPEGERLRDEAIRYAWEHEDDIQPVLDTMYFFRMIRERITIDTRAEFAGV
ncbi:MAG: DUF4838 domain-containing protein [Clostridia bacterium]|nr:DUF4838 domain-containing protein [Clostridia bacterium]